MVRGYPNVVPRPCSFRCFSPFRWFGAARARWCARMRRTSCGGGRLWYENWLALQGLPCCKKCWWLLMFCRFLKTVLRLNTVLLSGRSFVNHIFFGRIKMQNDAKQKRLTGIEGFFIQAARKRPWGCQVARSCDGAALTRRELDSQVDQMPGPNLRDGNGLKEFPPNEHRVEENRHYEGHWVKDRRSIQSRSVWQEIHEIHRSSGFHNMSSLTTVIR